MILTSWKVDGGGEAMVEGLKGKAVVLRRSESRVEKMDNTIGN